MYCPRDDFGLTNKVLSGSEVHLCTSCHGVWISKESILALAEATHAHALAEHIADEMIPKHFESGTLRCPNDATLMQFRLVDQVEIDLCPACHGVWLDKGEQETLAAQSTSRPTNTYAAANALDALIYLPGPIDAGAIDAAASALGEAAVTLGTTAADAGAALAEAAANSDGIGEILGALLGAIGEVFNS